MPLTYEEIYRNLDGLVAITVASRTTMGKTKGEKNTEFVKRIVAHYAHIAQHDPELRKTLVEI